MKCPKCAHQWTRPRKAKGPELPYSETSPGEVHPQRCWACERPIEAGEHVMAHTEMPAVLCQGCKGKIQRAHWTEALVAVA